MCADTRAINVFHIEDNRGDLDLFRSAFEDCCPCVHYLGETDPVAAMTNLEQRASERLPLSAIILLDLNMPKARGQDVLAFLRLDPDLRHLPVVVVTTSVRQEARASSIVPPH